MEHPQRPLRRRQGRPVGDIVVRPPVENLLDDGVLAMHAVVSRAGAPPAAGGLDSYLGDPGLPRHPLAGLGQELPGDLLRHFGGHRDRDKRILRRYPDAPARLLLLPAALEVMGPGRHAADPIVGLAVLAHPKRGRFEVGDADTAG